MCRCGQVPCVCSKQRAARTLAVLSAMIVNEPVVCLDCGADFGTGLDGITAQVMHDCQRTTGDEAKP